MAEPEFSSRRERRQSWPPRSIQCSSHRNMRQCLRGKDASSFSQRSLPNPQQRNTGTSTARRSNSVRRKIFLAAQWLLIIAIVWYAVAALRGQWAQAGARLQSLRPDWIYIAAATGVVLLTYLLLIETWRRIIIATGEQLPFREAARIWFVSNLGKYVPGKIWSIAAMTMMARERKVSGISAAGSSVLIQLVTVAAGIGVVLATGAQAVNQKAAAIIAVLVIVAGLAVTPMLLPAVGRVVSSLTGRRIELPRLPSSVIWMTAASS